MTTLRRLLIGLCLLASLPVSAASVYDLELVVFLNNGAPSSEVDAANPEHGARLDRRLTQLFERIGTVDTRPGDGGRLAGLADRIDASPDYTLLQHVRWRQEVALISEAPWIDVSALTLGEDSGLKGVTRFYHTPLLYVDVFLRFTPFQDPLTAGATAPPTAFGNLPLEADMATAPSRFLEEKRRLKINEVHYLDSARIGAIVGVWATEGESGATSQ